MANCSVLTNAGYQLTLDECAQTASGVFHNRIWAMSLREVLGWTESSTDNVYEDVTFGAGNGIYEMEVEKDTVQWRNEYDEATKSINQILSFRIPDLSIKARNWVQSTKGVDIVWILQLKAGPFQIIGKDTGARLFNLVGSSEGEEAGYAVEYRADNMDELSPHFLDTDVNTTLLTLAAKVATT